MPSTSQPRRPLSSLALFLFLALFPLFTLPTLTMAVERSTVFLPFKINAPDSAAVTGPADKALEREAMAKGMKMMPRSQAEKLVDYKGAWPPSAAALGKVV